jgi:RNA polymerase sigma factor (sigma-70 family)
MTFSDEKVILQRLQQGDQEELGKLYKTYRSEFLKWMTAEFSCTVHEATDIYQESVITLFENVTSGKLKKLTSNIKSYLFGIGKNKYYEYRKANYRYIFGIKEVQTFEVEEINKVEAEEKEAKLELVESCLEKLGEPCRSLLELYYFHKMSMEEIADALEYKNSNTTKNLKYKCLNRLRRMFNEELKKKLNQ